MAVHRCSCAACSRAVNVSSSMIPSVTVATLGLSLMPARPQIGIAVAVLGLVFHRELDQFFRYQCPLCGTALEILAEVA